MTGNQASCSDAAGSGTRGAGAGPASTGVRILVPEKDRSGRNTHHDRVNTIPFKTCQHCGKRNPRFLTHCLFCGEPLLEKRHRAGRALAVVQLVVVLIASVLVAGFVVVPAAQVAYGFGGDFVRNVTEQSAAALLPAPEYSLNQPAENGGLQVMVSSAQNGQYTLQSSKFFIVFAQLKNLQTEGNIRVTGGHFALIDSRGGLYFPYGIGSEVLYDIRPGESGLVQLTYIIPQDVTGTTIRFTFPEADGGTKKTVRFRL